jgi:hypothetical protein
MSVSIIKGGISKTYIEEDGEILPEHDEAAPPGEQ